MAGKYRPVHVSRSVADTRSACPLGGAVTVPVNAVEMFGCGVGRAAGSIDRAWAVRVWRASLGGGVPCWSGTVSWV
jgi:hypothetical protein